MDTQLACATYATIIPVLMLAGHMSSRWLAACRLFAPIRYGTLFYVVGIAVAEAAALLGVSSPTKLKMQFGQAGAIIELGGVIGMYFAAVAFEREPRTEEVEEGSG